MTKYIDKRQALEKLDEFVKLNEDCGFEYSALSLAMVSNMIDHIPAADVAPVVHGRWLHGCECSVCGDRHGPINEKLMPYYNFCSNCGAKMDGGDKT